MSSQAARRYAEDVVRDAFGAAPTRVRRRGGGRTNFVFQIAVAGASAIVRIHPYTVRPSVFERERHAMQLARAAGLRVPAVSSVGADPFPYMVAEHLPGVIGTRSRHRMAVVKQMGAITARIHQIPTDGFGPSGVDAGALGVPPRRSFGMHLELDLQASERIELLARLDVIPSAALERMRRTLTHMLGWRRNPVLHHGDMRLKNVLVDLTDTVSGILDWENCTGSVPALWDLSIALHDLSIDEKQTFLQGYGFTPRQLTKAIPYLRLLNALNYAPVMAAAAERGEKTRLNWYRSRIAGDFDLYQ